MNIDIIKRYASSYEIDTPSYILDMDKLAEHMDNVTEIIEDTGKKGIELCYAMKANAMIAGYMSNRTAHIEVCSPGELEICRHVGISGDKIIFSGVNKTKEDIQTAMDYDVDIVTLESVRQYNIVKSIATSNKKKVRILLRLTSGAQFGMNEEDVFNIIVDAEKDDMIDVIGIHYFTGTQKKNADKNKEELEYLKNFIDKLMHEYGFVPKLLEYGAGLSAPYFEGDDFEHIYDSLRNLTVHINSLNLPCKVGLELGRFLAYNSMMYITKVDDVKKTEDVNICLVDGGIHHVNYYGQNMAMRTPIIKHIHLHEEDNADKSEAGVSKVNPESHPEENGVCWRVCGSLCTFSDILARKLELKNLNTGDFLVFFNVGAYSMTESPALFLSRSMPAVYSYSDAEGLSLIRKRTETYSLNF